jgi:hypothetical protein
VLNDLVKKNFIIFEGYLPGLMMPLTSFMMLIFVLCFERDRLANPCSETDNSRIKQFVNVRETN